MIIAGIITVIFKWLGQPVIVGYIVAGIMAGPSISLFPTVSDQANIKIWADIGVIFLLFAIGLDFSFRKLISVGASAIFSTVIIVCGMMFLGYTAGNAMGFSHTSCIFLGGMLSMSSTAIVFKAFSDMGLLDQKFTGIVLGILIIEDVVAVIMMVVLSTLAVGKHFEGFEMLESILKLAAFLIFWSALGIYLIPTLLKRLNRFISNEILLTTSLGLCLGMVMIATKAGFSAALGAFIIASLGISLNVMDKYLYPVIVAVSVITTFLTPYMIRLSDPVYCFADRHLPQFLKDYLTHYSSGTMTTRHQGSWHKLIRSMLVSVTLYLVVCLFFIALFFSYAYPLVMGRIPGMKGSLLSFVLVLLIISPFLCAIIMKKNNSVEFRKLWADNRFNRGLLVSMIVIKVLICIIIVMGIIIRLFNVALGSGLILSFLIIVVIYFSKRIRKRSLSMEKQFLENFQGTAGTFPQEEPETGETSTEKNHELSNK